MTQAKLGVAGRHGGRGGDDLGTAALRRRRAQGRRRQEFAQVVLLDAVDIERKVAASLAYASQLGFQFGSRQAVVARLRAIASEAFA